MEEQEPPPNVHKLKERGNESVKNEKFEEAIIYYTQALKLDPLNYTVYSNRSYAFLKIHQHYLAFQDANETIRLEPTWAKGYFRRAEVEYASGLYDEAILSYGRALQLQPQDVKLIECIKRVTQTKKEMLQNNHTSIWLSTCIGLIIGIAIVISDYTLTEKATMTNPIIMVLFVMIIAGLGFSAGKAIVYLKQTDLGKSLQKPENFEKSSETSEKRNHHIKYNKAQARHRYKQGKT